MGRYIDTDKLKEAISKSNCRIENMWKKVVCDVIDNQQAAYNLEKVMEELVKIEEHCLDMHDWQGHSVIVDAIDIVRKGGVE